MEVLSAIEITWPSAGRALELLRGSKVNSSSTSLPIHGTQTVRPKRSVEQALGNRIPSPSQEQNHSYTAPEISRLGSFPVPESQAIYTASEMLVPHLSSQPHSVPYPYNRWPADSPNPFPGTLSTSVLPQVYSTGLFDDRAVAVNGQRVSSSALDPNAQTRFPQYWNDYSTYSQLGNYEFNDQQSQSHASPSHAFFSESYNRHI